MEIEQYEDRINEAFEDISFWMSQPTVPDGLKARIRELSEAVNDYIQFNKSWDEQQRKTEDLWSQE